MVSHRTGMGTHPVDKSNGMLQIMVLPKQKHLYNIYYEQTDAHSAALRTVVLRFTG